jgi:hypothetical protein
MLYNQSFETKTKHHTSVLGEHPQWPTGIIFVLIYGPHVLSVTIVTVDATAPLRKFQGICGQLLNFNTIRHLLTNGEIKLFKFWETNWTSDRASSTD